MRTLTAGIVFLLLATGVPGARGAPEPPWRLGVFFWHDSPNDRAALRGIRAALEVSRKPYELDVRRAGADLDEAGRILDELAGDPPDLLFAMGTRAALLAKERVTRCPIVFTAVTHPVESGVVEGWDGSGTHLAGNSNWIDPATVLHVFRLAVPGLERLGILRSERSGVVSGAELRGMRRWLRRDPRAPGLEIVDAVVRGPDELTVAVEGLLAADVQAIWIPIDFVVYENLEPVLDLAGSRGIPLVSSSMKGLERGAVAGVMVDYELLGQRAVVLALEILAGGADPGSLPVGTMAGYQVVANPDAAGRLGYELPLSLLVLADHIHGGPADGEGR